MTAKLVAALSLVAALGWTSSALAAGSKEAGQAKAATCSACHGMDGNSLNPEWPNLAGQGEVYIVRQLKAFHAGQRQNVLMSPMAAILSDAGHGGSRGIFFLADRSRRRGGSLEIQGGPARLPLRQGQRAGDGLRRLSWPGRQGQRTGGIPGHPRPACHLRGRAAPGLQVGRTYHRPEPDDAQHRRPRCPRTRSTRSPPSSRACVEPCRASRVSIRHEQEIHRHGPVAARGRPAAGCRARRLVRRTRRRQAVQAAEACPAERGRAGQGRCDRGLLVRVRPLLPARAEGRGMEPEGPCALRAAHPPAGDVEPGRQAACPRVLHDRAARQAAAPRRGLPRDQREGQPAGHAREDRGVLRRPWREQGQSSRRRSRPSRSSRKSCTPRT